MALNERFIVGRIKRRILRAPALEGWLCDERGANAPERTSLALSKQGGGFVLPTLDGGDMVPLGDAASELVAEGDVELLIGWPERIVLVRKDGAVLAGEGDVVHFGRLCLDAGHAIERTGYEYLSEEGIEVRVELAVQRGGGEVERRMLGPGETTTVGPYAIEHQHSYDPSDRPSGVRHHGYAFRVRRAGAAVPRARPGDASSPIDVEDPAVVVALARARGLLGDDEALMAEPEELEQRLARYEGPRQKLEEALREAGPTPPVLHRLGDAVVAETARLFRGSHGEARWGRARVVLHATGDVDVARTELGEAPGRLRRAKK